MDKSGAAKNILKQLKSKKVKDYTFISLFFLIFSVFIVFAIRPSLITAIALRQQREDLQKLDTQYESVVSNIVANQSTLENIRDGLYLINDALPTGALINKLISDIENEGKADVINFIRVDVGEVNLVQKTTDKAQSVVINIEATSSFEDLLKFVQGLSNQRRLKLIKQLSIYRDSEQSSESGQLKILMQIEGYYL